MEKLNIAPTKSNLLTMKEQLSVSENGYNLLEQKREILVQELMRMVDKVKMQKLLEQKAILDSKLETAEIDGNENLKREIIAQIIELNKELNSGKR